jgi:quinol monooxygenase YgiN
VAVAEHAHVVRVSTFPPADGRRDELVEVCTSLAELARSADGCFGAQVCTLSERPGVLAVVSRWRDPSAVEAFTGPRTNDALRQLEGLLAGVPTTEHYVAVS